MKLNKKGSVNSRYTLLALKIIIGVTILLILFYKIGFSKIYLTFLSFKLIYLIPLIILYLLLYLLSTLNLFVLFKATNTKISFLKLLRFFLISFGLGKLSPGRIGEFSFIFLLKKENVPMSESSSVMLLDKIVTIFSFFIISIIGLPIFFSFHQSLKLILIIIALISIIIILFFTRIGRNLIKKYILRKYASSFAGFSRNLFSYFRENKKYLLMNISITAIKFIVAVYIIQSVFMAFGAKVNFLYILLVYSIGAITTFIPITISGIGIKETSAVLLYTQLGIDTIKAGSTQLFILIFGYIVVVIMALLINKSDLQYIRDLEKRTIGKLIKRD